MGGLGSGNRDHRWRKKTVVEDCLEIDANRWMREGILRADVHRTGSWRWTYTAGGSFLVNYEVNTLDQLAASVHLWYSWEWTATKERDSANYRVDLTATRPHLGGLRWWFLCPLTVNHRACTRQVGRLYLPPDARYFGCRHCYDLTYTTCQKSHKFDRFHRRMACNLGWDLETLKWVLKESGRRR